MPFSQGRVGGWLERHPPTYQSSRRRSPVRCALYFFIVRHQTPCSCAPFPRRLCCASRFTCPKSRTPKPNATGGWLPLRRHRFSFAARLQPVGCLLAESLKCWFNLTYALAQLRSSATLPTSTAARYPSSTRMAGPSNRTRPTEVSRMRPLAHYRTTEFSKDVSSSKFHFVD